MSLFGKIPILIVACAFVITSSFAQEEHRNLSQVQSSSKHSLSSLCETNSEVKCSWGFFTSASFIYWIPYQENMELGIVSINRTTTFDSTVDGEFVSLDFNYKPGFKLGMGINSAHDDWDIYSEYTWYRGSHTVSVSLDPADNLVLLPKWQIPETVMPEYLAGSEKWRLNMDLLDFELGKTCCISKNLSFRSFFSARAAWIRQSLQVAYLNDTTGSNSQNVYVTQRFHSWALGPRLGVKMNWRLGCGFRMFGNGSGDILYTSYRKVSFKQQGFTSAGAIAAGSVYKTKQKVNTLRNHLDLEFGFGWGRYFTCKKKTHIDLSACYGFQVFFDQNMFRLFVDDQALASSFMPVSNLFIHGLRTTLRLDF